MECELAEITETENLHAVVGRIVNVSADEIILMLGDSSEDHMARCGSDWVMTDTSPHSGRQILLLISEEQKHKMVKQLAIVGRSFVERLFSP